MDDLWTRHGPEGAINTMEVAISVYPGVTVWTGKDVYPEAGHERTAQQEVGATSFIPAVVTKSAHLRKI